MKAAVIGLGPHGRRLVAALNSMSGVELTAVVDHDPAALAATGIGAQVARFRSLSELTTQQNPELVCVATNGPSHAELAIAAMEHGARYLLVEKPMACSLAECDRILATARETKCRVAVDHARRHAPVYLWLRKCIASGEWGAPRAIWMQRPGIGLGCNATHSFDTIAFLLDRKPRQVTGWVDKPIGANPRGSQFVDPGGLVVLEFEGGIRGVVAQIEDGAGPTSVEIDMTAARIRLDERSGEIEVVERDLSVVPGPGRPPLFHTRTAPAGLTAQIDLASMIRGCLEELLGCEPMIADAQHGRSAIEILVAAYLSDCAGHAPVCLPLVKREELETWLPVT